MEGLEFPFHSTTPGVLGSSPLAPPLWCPMKGCAGYIALFSSADVPDPPPSPLLEDVFHVVLAAAGEKVLVGDGLGPKDAQDPSEVLGVEGGELVEVALRHPPAFRAVQ